MKSVFADIITIGDEILYGQITDTNSQWISTQLDAIGVKVNRKISIGDEESEIISCLFESLNRSDIVLITGGLGPTKDDKTKQTLAKYFDMPLELDQDAYNDVKDLFSRFGKEMTEINRQQAFLPKGCVRIRNERGTASGMWFDSFSKVIVSMPGVPFEMKSMMTKEILPKLQVQFALPVIKHIVIKTIGIGESWLSEKIAEWEDNLPDHMGLAYLPGKGNVRLRLTGRGIDNNFLESEMNTEIDKVLPIIDKYVYGFGDKTIEEAIGDLLRKNNKTIATAESCTGGYLSHRITSVSGSSDYFKGTVVAYRNEIKQSVLSVSPDTLEQYGAVSEQTAKEMALGVRKLINSSIGIAITGIAGPEGGSDEKPVGTIWMALSTDKQVYTQKIQLPGTRMLNIEMTGLTAMDFIRQHVENG